MPRLDKRLAALLLALPWAFPAAWAEERVALQLKWTHSFQFAGYYMAKEKGYYQAAGLDVELRESGPDGHYVDEVYSGRAQYGTGSTNVLLDRNKGLPVVVLAVIFQHSPEVLMTLRTSGITSPYQLAGKRVMLSPAGTPAIAPMLLNTLGSLDKITLLAQANDMQALIDGRIDAMSGYYTDQPYVFQGMGFPVHVLRPIYYGVDFYGDNLFTTEAELRSHPDRVKAFRQASLKGWEYAMAHPEEAIAAVQKQGYPFDAEHLRYEYNTMKELLLPEFIEMGQMNAGRWRHVADTYVQLGMLRPDYSLEGFLYAPHSPAEFEKLKRYALFALAGVLLAAAIILALVGFNRRLRWEVRERMRVELQLRQSEQRLLEAQQIAHIGSWEWDMAEGCAIWSDETYRLLGYAPGEVEPSVENFLAAIHPQDRAKVREEIAAAQRRADGVYALECRVLLPGGGERLIDGRGRVVFDGQGRPLRIIGTSLDITRERKRGEQDLAESRARLACVVDSAMDAIIAVDGEQRVLLFNAAAEKMFRCPAAEACGRPITQFIPERFRQADIESLFGAGGQPADGGAPLCGLRPDGGEFPVESSIAKAEVGGGKLYTVILRDVTERKRAEQALRDAARRKDEFLAMLAHELRNPLAPILTAVQLLGQPGAVIGAQAEWCRDVLERQVRHIARLLDDLLDVARIMQGKVTLKTARFSLGDIVGQALETSRPLIESRRQALSVALPESVLWLEGDSVRLAQVLSNLLNNAAKYTPECGQIALAATVEEGCAVLRVRDDGIGIAQDLLPHVFDLFTQADRPLAHAQGGLGIGLALVRKLVELHGGSVAAASAGLGQGSEFTVRLPLPPPAAPAPAMPALRGLRVLVVDDYADAAQILALLLREVGHEVETAECGAEALRRAAAFSPQAVVLDIGLPDLDGYEVARRLRQLPQTRAALLVALSGYGREDDRKRSQAVGFDHHLLKPVDLQTLSALIESAGPGRAA
jgi:PAS domain S-box-containing protein